MTVDVAFEERGPTDAPPLILSSSLGTTSEMWDAQVEPLSERFRVIVYDHRGHGRSPVPPGPYTLEELARDVLSLMDRLSIGKTSFAGLSLGGMVGMWLGANAVDRVDRLALLCTFADVRSREMWRDRAALVRESGTASMADASIDRWFTPGFQRSHPAVVSRYREILADISDEGYAGCCEAIETMDVASSLDRIGAPTLVIAGSDDGGATPEVMRNLTEAIPGARYAEAKAAHLANVEQSGEVTELLSEHFAGQ